MIKLFSAAMLVLLLVGCAEPPPYTNVDNQKLQTLVDQGIPLIDIRRPDEWRQTGVIEGSKKLTFVNQAGRVNPAFLPTFTETVSVDEPVILICRTGNRTDALARHLIEKMGYSQVYNVEQGIMGWLREGLPVSRRQG